MFALNSILGTKMVQLGESMAILELHRQGLTISAIATWLGMDRNTVRKNIKGGTVREK